MLFLIILINRKWLLSKLSFIELYTFLFNFPNACNYLKSLAFNRRYMQSIIDKALNKFKELKCSVCLSDVYPNSMVLPFYSSISFKITKILSQFGLKVSINFLTNSNYYLLNTLFLMRTDVVSISFLPSLVFFVTFAKQYFRKRLKWKGFFFRLFIIVPIKGSH